MDENDLDLNRDDQRPMSEADQLATAMAQMAESAIPMIGVDGAAYVVILVHENQLAFHSNGHPSDMAKLLRDLAEELERRAAAEVRIAPEEGNAGA